MPRLFIHVGHGKTGSSFIQSTFANSINNLKENRIVYPVNDRIRLAASGGISSGNGSMLLNEFKILENHNIKSDDSILVSGEILFNKLLSKDVIENTEAILSKFNITEISCLLFIRDPIAHAASFYQQLIKREGYTSSIESFFETYKTPQVVYSFIKELSTRPMYSITVNNYSYVKKDINQCVADWLSIPKSSLSPPNISTVNRSLTHGELTMQRYLNTALGRSGNIISDRLCEKLPHIKSEVFLPDSHSQNQLWARLNPAIEKVNAMIDPKHHYTNDSKSPSIDQEQDTFKFSSAQLREIVDGFSQEIVRLRGKKAK